jgi:hypothetical protein
MLWYVSHLGLHLHRHREVLFSRAVFDGAREHIGAGAPNRWFVLCVDGTTSRIYMSNGSLALALDF